MVPVPSHGLRKESRCAPNKCSNSWVWILTFLERFPYELSGGQKQRVGVARAIAADPPILLLDEPFGALDPMTRSEIQQEFAELHRRLGKTAVFVTHDVREAFLLGTRESV